MFPGSRCLPRSGGPWSESPHATHCWSLAHSHSYTLLNASNHTVTHDCCSLAHNYTATHCYALAHNTVAQVRNDAQHCKTLSHNTVTYCNTHPVSRKVVTLSRYLIYWKVIRITYFQNFRVLKHKFPAVVQTILFKSYNQAQHINISDNPLNTIWFLDVMATSARDTGLARRRRGLSFT